MPLDASDAPKAQFGQIVPIALTCRFGTSQTEGVEQLRSRGVQELNGKRRDVVPVALVETAVGFSTPQLLDSWTAVSTEQSENVYENKGQFVRYILHGPPSVWRSNRTVTGLPLGADRPAAGPQAHGVTAHASAEARSETLPSFSTALTT